VGRLRQRRALELVFITELVEVRPEVGLRDPAAIALVGVRSDLPASVYRYPDFVVVTAVVSEVDYPVECIEHVLR